MYCSQCGQSMPPDANFCPSCGEHVQAESQREGGADPDSTTASIDPGVFDDRDPFEGTPALAPGTGMLVVVRGPNAGARFLIDRDLTTIGRHPDSDIFLDDVTVSRRHAEIAREDRDTLVLSDLGSLNGTYVDGERVERRELAAGDELQVGRFKLLFVGSTGESE